MLRTCSKCGEDLPWSSFYRKTNNVSKTSSLRSACKQCTNAQNSKWVASNKEKHIKMQADWYLKNVDKVKTDSRKWREANREKYNERASAYKKKYWANSEDYRAKCAEQNKAWRESNRKKIRLYKKGYARALRASSPHYRLNQNMGRVINLALNGQKAGKKWEDITGYSVDELILHLESLFTEGMSWDNYGEWHVDHIAPRKIFVVEDIDGNIDWETVGCCWDLSNLQPLWAKDNFAKGGEFHSVSRSESVSRAVC